MRMRSVGALLLSGGIALFLLAGVRADEDHVGPYRFLTTVKINGDLAGGFDISWVDSTHARYYLADRGNATLTPPIAPTVDVIDTRRGTLVTQIALNARGNGVVAIHKSAGDDDEEDSESPGEVWVGDSNSFVEVIDLKTNTIVADIPTHGVARADELAFDPRDGIIVVANDQDPIPFLSFISTKTRMVIGTLPYPQVVFGTPPKGHGLEQTVWNSRAGKFYLSVPATSANPKGEVNEIDPVKMIVTRVIPTTCGPAGLALVPEQRLVTSCGDIVTLATGKVTNVAGLSADEIWFNRGDERVYFGARVTVPVLDVDSDSVVATLTVGDATVTPAHTTHSVAADSHNNRIFVPVSHEGVKIYTDARQDDNHE